MVNNRTLRIGGFMLAVAALLASELTSPPSFAEVMPHAQAAPSADSEPLPLPVEILDLQAKSTQVYEAEYVPEEERRSYNWRVAELNRRFQDVWRQLASTHSHLIQASVDYDAASLALQEELRTLQREAPPATAEISDVNAYNRRCLDHNRKVIALKEQFKADVAETTARMDEKQKLVEDWLKTAPIASLIQDGDNLLQRYKTRLPQSPQTEPVLTQPQMAGPVAVNLRDPKTGTTGSITVDVVAEWQPLNSTATSAKRAANNRTSKEESILHRLVESALNDPRCPALLGKKGAARNSELTLLSRRLEQRHEYLRKNELKAIESIKFLRHYEITQGFEGLRNKGRCKDAADLANRIRTDSALAHDVATIVAKANAREQTAMQDVARHYDEQLRKDFRKVMGYAIK